MDASEAYHLFEHDLSAVARQRILENEEDGDDVWGSLANVGWFRDDFDGEVSYSFRAAGRMIAEVIQTGDYLDWYCSGNSGEVVDWFRDGMKERGWFYKPEEIPDSYRVPYKTIRREEIADGTTGLEWLDDLAVKLRKEKP